MENDLIQIFIGSEIETNYISTILEENGIAFITKNILNQSISAGWASGSPYSSSIILVNRKDAETAKQLINEYIKGIES